MDKLDMLFSEIKEIIDGCAGEVGRDFVCGSFEGMGWLNFHYKCTTYDGLYPRIALKCQKKKVHLYVMMWRPDGEPVLAKYENLFGKSNVGKGCLRIKSLDDARVDAIRELVALAIIENEN
ncbi:MAG: DUF1801 domain-containing protein [Defluviitaleaceae bacterium]|nr:DUF1801 domain-containing protein [Defluviitaleaceae bacterium]